MKKVLKPQGPKVMGWGRNIKSHLPAETLPLVHLFQEIPVHGNSGHKRSIDAEDVLLSLAYESMRVFWLLSQAPRKPEKNALAGYAIRRSFFAKRGMGEKNLHYQAYVVNAGKKNRSILRNNFLEVLKIENCPKIMVGLTQSRIFFPYYYLGNFDYPRKCIKMNFNLFEISGVPH